MSVQLVRNRGPCYAVLRQDRPAQALRQLSLIRPAVVCAQRRMARQNRHTLCAASALSAQLVEPDLAPQGPSDGNGRHGGNGICDRGDGASGDGDFGHGAHAAMLRFLLSLAVAAVAMLSPLPAHAWGSKSKKLEKQKGRKASALPDNKELDEFASRMAGLAGPILTNMGFSGIVGACSAAALKSVGRRLAALVGVAFIGMQALTYYGFITVNWTKVSDAAREALDATGDGRLDENDLRRWIKKGMVVMSQGLPSTSGFLLGFMTGLRMF